MQIQGWKQLLNKTGQVLQPRVSEWRKIKRAAQRTLEDQDTFTGQEDKTSEQEAGSYRTSGCVEGCITCLFIKGKNQMTKLWSMESRAELGSTEPGQNISVSDGSLWRRPKFWWKTLVIMQKRWVDLWPCKGIKNEEDGWMKSWMSQPLPQKGNLETGQELLSIFATRLCMNPWMNHPAGGTSASAETIHTVDAM